MYNPYYPQYQQPSIPQQQVLQANGKASIDAMRMPPNSSVLVMDTTAPIVWLCASDSLGNVTSTPYDIKAHRSESEAKNSDIEQRLSALENTVKELMKHEPNDGNFKPREDVGVTRTDSAY